MGEEEDIAVSNFREYLTVNTEHPNPDYEKCKNYLFKLASELNIAHTAYYTSDKTPFIIMTIPGTDNHLPSLMLYSHTDVVPTFKEHWKYDPYSGYKDAEGNIYGRGAQDMKCVGIQYFEAIRRHFQRGKKKWLRTIHIVWGPDEEIASPEGMRAYSKTEDFKQLNVGFVLDEGVASADDVYNVYYAERCPWWIKVTCNGNPGHAMNFIENTAMEKLQYVINSALAFRAAEKKRKEENNLLMGEVTTTNMTIINGGVQCNVVPEKYTVYIDMRVTPLADFDGMEDMVKGWCQNAGPDVTYEYMEKVVVKKMTPTTDDDPWWKTFSTALSDLGCKVKKQIFVGATDSRVLREMGYKAIGFSPMINTPMLLHDHNEYLNDRVFLRGVEIYETLIDRLADIRADP